MTISTAPRQNWRTDALRAQLEPLLPNLTVEVLARCDSTNTLLAERLRAPTTTKRATKRGQADAKPCLLVAEHQAAGRGTAGRTWRSSPEASLTFSLALPLVANNWQGLSLAIGVALVEALQPAPPEYGLALGLKWPNDLWLVDSGRHTGTVGGDQPVRGRKLGGILIETLKSGWQRFVVVGIGLNVLSLPRLIAAELPEDVACLQELDSTVTGPDVLARAALPVVQALKIFERDGFSAFAARYAQRDVRFGRQVDTGVSHGRARGVSSQSAFSVETASGLHSVTNGEVCVRAIDSADEFLEVV